MFQKARMQPVRKDESFTLVSPGLKQYLLGKCYNAGARGDVFRRSVQEVFENVRTVVSVANDASGVPIAFLPLSIVLAGRPCTFLVEDTREHGRRAHYLHPRPPKNENGR